MENKTLVTLICLIVIAIAVLSNKKVAARIPFFKIKTGNPSNKSISVIKGDENEIIHITGKDKKRSQVIKSKIIGNKSKIKHDVNSGKNGHKH